MLLQDYTQLTTGLGHGILHVFGVDTQQSYWYDFWSGIATQASLVAGTSGLYRRHNCHVKGCWRMWHHEITDADGLVHKVCHRHHPGRPRHIHLHHIQTAWAAHTARHRAT